MLYLWVFLLFHSIFLKLSFKVEGFNLERNFYNHTLVLTLHISSDYNSREGANGDPSSILGGYCLSCLLLHHSPLWDVGTLHHTSGFFTKHFIDNSVEKVTFYSAWTHSPTSKGLPHGDGLGALLYHNGNFLLTVSHKIRWIK